MKVVDVVGRKVAINNEEHQLYELVKTREVNFIKLNERQQKVAFDLYLKNVFLIDDDGDIVTNDPHELVDILW